MGRGQVPRPDTRTPPTGKGPVLAGTLRPTAACRGIRNGVTEVVAPIARRDRDGLPSPDHAGLAAVDTDQEAGGRGATTGTTDRKVAGHHDQAVRPSDDRREATLPVAGVASLPPNGLVETVLSIGVAASGRGHRLTMAGRLAKRGKPTPRVGVPVAPTGLRGELLRLAGAAPPYSGAGLVEFGVFFVIGGDDCTVLCETSPPIKYERRSLLWVTATVDGHGSATRVTRSTAIVGRRTVFRLSGRGVPTVPFVTSPTGCRGRLTGGPSSASRPSRAVTATSYVGATPP